jgi:mannose-6-phosphate isomerase-like protein (cupin superfamily)
MKKTNLTDFGIEPINVDGKFIIQPDDYLKTLTINKIIVLPLCHIQGNIESKTGKDSVIIVLEGSGSMEVNGARAPISVGDVIQVKADESFIVHNETLNSSLQFVSLFSKK